MSDGKNADDASTHTSHADSLDALVLAAPTSMCRTSVLAAMFAVPVCCPPMSLLACVTGVIALRQIRRDRLLHGAWLAWVAIVFGAACAVVMSWLLWTSGLSLLWRGPNPPMQALMTHSTQNMRELWNGPAAEYSQQQLAEFSQALTRRYGEFRGAAGSEIRPTPLEQSGARSVATVPITLQFESGSIEADLGLQRFDERTKSSVMKWRSLRVIDSVKGDLVFPDGEPPPKTLESMIKPRAIERRPAPISTSDTPSAPLTSSATPASLP